MIVKNEMANLERCLAAVAPHIDRWVIGDTSDDTQDFVTSFFAQHPAGRTAQFSVYVRRWAQ
jgi:hypothetical protein